MDCICSGKGLYSCFQLVQRDYVSRTPPIKAQVRKRRRQNGERKEKLTQRKQNSCSNKACNTTLLTSGARKREFITEPITEITAEKKEEERRKSTAEFAAGFALLKPRQQHYYGCQSYTKSPYEPCQDRWELYVFTLPFPSPLNVDELTMTCSCESCHCLARDDCDRICAQSWVSLNSKKTSVGSLGERREERG
jgi:hypothetical protein